jgi:hypothetical protein
MVFTKKAAQNRKAQFLMTHNMQYYSDSRQFGLRFTAQELEG